MKFILRSASALAIGFASIFSSATSAAPPVAVVSSDGLWRSIDETMIAPRQPRQIVPDSYRTHALNLSALRAQLASAPLESTRGAKSSETVISLPRPDGTFARFAVAASPIMEPELASRFPEIRTYVGQGLDDATESLRFDTTPAGLHAQVLSAKGTWYVDPFQPGDVDHYIAYARRDYRRDRARSFTCGVVSVDDSGDVAALSEHDSLLQPMLAAGETLRTYRLAVAATGEYTQFHGSTVAAGLAGIVTTMNRVNGIYERDVAVRMVLVVNNDRIVYTDPANDPYTDDNPDALLDENQSNLTSVIGNASYDVGHVFSTGGGGVASLGSVCSTSRKALGVTGSGAPIGDAYDVDYVAHEMGHQFNAPHTFNTGNPGCGGQRSSTAAYETGSGTTVMAYAGICGSENLQPNSDDYFHRASLTTILNFVSGGGGNNCDAPTATGNTAPSVSAPAAFTIPRQTPFALTASGNDPDGDALTYLWEQFDLGASTSGGVAIVDNGTRPLFRPADPVTSPARIFPSLRYILGNANVPPASAPLPGTTTPSYYTGEALPTTNRTLNFRVTARDNRAGGGGTNEASTALTVTNAAGPFAVTSPNTSAVLWNAGSSQTVAWAVANTNLAPVSTSQVRVSLSLDGGNTFPIVLAAATANDGEELVAVPAGPATAQARVRVEAVGNVYFDISDASFAIAAAAGGNTPPSIVPTGNIATRQGSPQVTANVATVADAQDAPGALVVNASGAPPELALSIGNAGGIVALSATASCELVAPTSGNRAYPILLTVTDSAGGTASNTVNVNVASNIAPTLGAYGGASAAPGVTTTVTPSTLPADGNGNFFGMSVSPTVLPGGGTVTVAPNGVVTVATTAGTVPGRYPIRVSAQDSCGATESVQFMLTVTAPGEVFNDSFEPL